MPSVPFKLNQDRRHHIPRQKRKLTNWREYDAALCQRGSLTVWFTDEAVQAWRAEPRTTRGGQPDLYGAFDVNPDSPDGSACRLLSVSNLEAASAAYARG